MVSVNKLKGTQVYAKRGIKIGEVEDVELDANNWAIKQVDVKMNDDLAKIYGEKAGFLQKKIVALPAEKMGPMSGDTITLKEELSESDIETLRGEMKTTKPW